ncbi:MAG: MarP family serine protease [Actinomycetota bacterium]|nr:MarP family serine protease [Actinomycetota bacterium]
MNSFDLAILLVVATSVVGGYRLGLLVGGTSWIFLIQALVLSTLVLPGVVTFLGGSSPGLRLLLGALFFAGAGFGGHCLGRLVGARFRTELPLGSYLRSDRVAGAVTAPIAVVVALWLLVLPFLSGASGFPARLARHSAIARGIDGLLPEAPDTSQALSRLAGPAASPQVFGGLVPSLDTGPPPTDAGLSPEVVARVSASTVKVEAVACRNERDGSGFTAGPDLVVTNAHVVAGQSRPTVVRHDGARLPAVVALFDPRRDLALLRVPDLGRPPLPIATGEVGATAAVFGHPDGQADVRVAPAAIRQQLNALGRDLYALNVTRRNVFVLAAHLHPGDSGAGVVNEDGEVVGVAFAIAPDNDDTAYALSTEELRAVLQQGAAGQADVGPCL